LTVDTQNISKDLFNIIKNIEIKHNLIKRLFDIYFSLALIVLLSPLFITIALAIFLTSPGPIIYGHKRIGRGGVIFKCLKFRTMYIDADVKLKSLLESDQHIKEEWLKNRKLKNDPRVIKIGNFLRKTSLDELPQFFNVLKGDLSVVGPRPVMDDEILSFFGAKASKILKVRPGITGLWQTSGRSNIDYEKRIALDEQYVDEHNLWLDIKLIVKTVPCVLFSKGAY
jgi:exopolysaccharide production protein ExoY